jgi:type II secretory pathway component GspD/PulD (secretin)
MTVKSNCFRTAAALTFIGVTLLIGGAAVGEPQARKKATSPEAASSVVTRVFTLKHTEPAEVVQAIGMFLDSMAALNAPAGGAPVGPAGPRPGPQGPAGGGAIGGAGILRAGPGGTAAHDTRVFLDERTGSIAVRGPDSEVQVVADLVTLLDNPADMALPEVKSMRAYTLKHAAPSGIAELANSLDLRVAVLPLDDAKLLVVAGPSEAMRELGDLVKMLDIATPKTQPEKRKKLFSPRAAS